MSVQNNDCRMIGAFVKGFVYNKPPENPEYDRLKCPGCSGSFQAKLNVNGTVLNRHFADSDCDGVFNSKLDEEAFSKTPGSNFVQFDGNNANIELFGDSDSEDGRVTWNVSHADGKETAYTMAFKNERQAERLGKKLRKAAEKGQAEAFLECHAEKAKDKK